MMDDASIAECMFGATSPKVPTTLITSGATMSHDDVPAAHVITRPEDDDPDEFYGVDATETKTPEEQAEALYGPKEEETAPVEIPPEIAKLRAEDSARTMYSPQSVFAEVIHDNIFAQAEDAHTIDQKHIKATIKEMREIACDLGLSAHDAALLRDRAAALSREPVEAGKQIDVAVDMLNRTFGREAKQALNDARKLVARDFRVGRLIESLGLGNDPETVVTLARAARSQRNAGRLK